MNYIKLTPEVLRELQAYAKTTCPSQSLLNLADLERCRRELGINIDGGSYDLRPDLDEREPPKRIPLKAPAKTHSISAGHFVRRAIDGMMARRDIRHVLEPESF